MHLRDHGEVLLALVALEGVLERDSGVLGAACGREHVGEVGESAPLIVEAICPLRDCYRLAGEWFRIRGFAAKGMDLRLHLAPEHLRHDVLFAPELAAQPCQRLSLVVAPKDAE